MFKEYSWKSILLLALLAAAVNIAPIAISQIGGDLLLNQAQIQCFSQQIWSGHFYPRWCMEANLGMGSPILLFYFPLPFYLSAIFYPLYFMGASLYTVFLFSAFALGVIGFIICVLWLKDLVKPDIAYFCAFIFLWLPYRVELQGFRVSYAELSAVTFLPLLFLYTRKIISTNGAAWPALSTIVAICLMLHAPATLMGLMAAGVYVLAFAYNKWRVLAAFACSVLLGFSFTIFHWLATTHFSTALNDGEGGVSYWQKSWVNSYVDSFLKSGHLLCLVELGIMAIFITTMLVYIFRKALPHMTASQKKEFKVWVAIVIFATLLMFSPSSPLWTLIEMVSRVKTPWRMSMLLMFGSVYFLAVAMRSMDERARKLRVGDRLAFSILIMICGLLMVGEIDNEHPDIVDRLYSNYYIPKYALPKWVDDKYVVEPEDFYAEYELPKNTPRAAFVHKAGEAHITQWNYDGINITLDAKRADILRIEHFYFPLWYASLDGKPVDIHVQEKEGRMLLDIPRGPHQLKLWIDVNASMPPYYRYIWLLSLAVACVIGYGFYRNRKLAFKQA
jgi:hypothetical protein